jgi:hypothetical protein
MPTIAPLMPEGRHKYFDSNGRPLAFGKIYTYAAGTTTPKDTFTDSAGISAHQNPITLDAKGEATIFWSGAYKVDVKTAEGVSILGYPVDNYQPDPAGVLDIYTTLSSSAGASSVGFVQPYAGAIPQQFVSVLDFYANGVSGAAVDNTGLVDSRLGIQAAINAAATLGKFLYVPAGTYNLTKGPLQAAASGDVYPCLTMVSGMHIMAEPGATFRLADDQSTNSTPLNIPMFFSNGVLQNISFHNLKIDQNGEKNPINGANNTFAHIQFSGSPDDIAASGTNVYINNCKFVNTPGVTCIGMAQTELEGATLGNNWVIENCLFENNGLDSRDHSSIYALADNVLCSGNVFTSDMMAEDKGGQVAYEFHGANQRFIGNKVKNYYQGVWVAANKTSDCDNNIVANNNFSPIADYGVNFYRESAAESVINNISIIGNTFVLSDRSTCASFKAAVAIPSAYPVTNVLIADNIASKVGTNQASVFCLITLQGIAVSTTHTGIKIDSNKCLNMTSGIFMTTAVNGIGLVQITNNEFKDFALAGSETQTRGIYLERLSGLSEVEELVISGNTFSNFTGAMTYGIYLQSGSIVNLFVGNNNSYKGVTNKYVEGATVTNRAGWYPSKEYTPVVDIGGAVTIGNGSVEGSYVYENGLITAFVKYVVGSTDVIPGGNINIGLPMASINAGHIYMGQWRISDASSGFNYFDAAQNDGTGQLASLRINGGTIATNASPVALAAGDIINLQMTYKAAAY